MTRPLNRRLLPGLLVCLLIAGCGGIEMFGKADGYQPRASYAVDIVMPPNANFISQQFRPREEHSMEAHDGIDVWGKIGTPILAAAPGRVTASFYEPKYGNRVEIDHGTDVDGKQVKTVYKHLKVRIAEKGDVVARGQQVGTMGATGALGMMVHLHFEVLRSTGQGNMIAHDPQLFWTQGPGRVTCFDATATYADQPFQTTYPVKCRAQ